MFSQIKLYLSAILAGAMMLFAAWFKYRGDKIDDLEKEIENHEAKDKAQDFEAQNREAAARAEAEDAKSITSDTYTI